jgi:alkylation response protein AidB-like acyl-CoA dehydrogenase
MDFSFTKEQIDFRESIIKFAEKELNIDSAKHEQEGTFPMEYWKKCADFSIIALPFPEEYGGCGMDLLTTAISIEALGYGCKDNGLVHALVSQIICGIQIYLFGNEEQKKEYLPKICNGENIGAQAITEADAGSDVSSMKTRAEKKENVYIVDGTKMFITNGPIADFALVFAVTDPSRRALGGISCFIVDKETNGFTRCKAMEKLGLRTLQNGELVFENCQIKSAKLLGKEGQGAIMFNEAMEWERILLFASHLGKMDNILKKSINYARERHQFGQSIGKFQSISNKIAEMKVNLELSKLILYKAAWLKDQKKRATIEASISKLFISESIKKACLDAVQIHGANGYMKEFEIERDLRDSIASSIYSGTSEIQKNIISSLLGL